MQTHAERNDHYALMSTSEILGVSARYATEMEQLSREWGYFSISDFKKKSSLGDESLVAQSEIFLREIEDQVPMSRGWRNVDDVVGAVPNIPAFLAGHPQHMRRRERTMLSSAPVHVHVDLTSSAIIDKKIILKRGIVLLALVRMLVEHRSVELWVGTTLSDEIGSGTVAWRIDTSPMDLARAAYQISDPAMSRLFGYAVCRGMRQRRLTGHWVRHEEKIRRLHQIGGWSDVLHVPRIHASDPMVTDPVGWLRRTMAQYVGGEE
jgi:hypothetical protein